MKSSIEVRISNWNSPSSTSFLAAASSNITLGTNRMTVELLCACADGDDDDSAFIIRIFFLEEEL